MRLKYLSAACLSFLSINAFANTSNIYDTDGTNRQSNLSTGPVSSLITASSAARELTVYVHRENINSSCHHGTVYDQNSGETITSVNIASAGAMPLIDKVDALLPDSALNTVKVLKLTCTDENNDTFAIHHKIPAAPQITWNATVEPTGEFVYQNQSYNYHNEIRYSGIINVNNQTTEGYCYSSADRGVPLYLFHGNNGKGDFHSDVFVADRTFTNTAPVLYQSVTCVNPAGRTRILKVWELTEENEINLIVDELIIR